MTDEQKSQENIPIPPTGEQDTTDTTGTQENTPKQTGEFERLIEEIRKKQKERRLLSSGEVGMLRAEKLLRETTGTTGTQENTPIPPTREQGTKDTAKTPPVLSPENQSFSNRVVDKMRITWNQRGIDQHQRVAVRFKSEMDGFDSRIGELNQGKKKIESKIEELKQKNIPGVELSLRLRIQETEQQITRLLNDKDRTQSKFEERNNKIKLCANERDRVANRFIERYEGKLRPMEAELKGLQTYREQINLWIDGNEIKHKGQLAELDGIEKDRNEIADILREIGTSEGKIRKDETIKQLDRKLTDFREKVRVEKENLARRRAKIAEIDREIAKVDAKANLYRDEREEFVRIKEGRPIEFNMPERQRSEEFEGEENVKAHPRSGAGTEKSPDSGGTKEEAKKGAEVNKQSAATYIDDWNEFLKDKYKDAEELDKKDFLEKTGLSENTEVDLENFKDHLAQYLKHYKKVPMAQFYERIDKFQEKVRDEEKA